MATGTTTLAKDDPRGAGVAGERKAEDIQRDIEHSRAALAEAVDQLAYRTNPKRVSDNVKQSLREKAQSTQGKIVIGVAGGVVALLIIKRIRKH